MDARDVFSVVFPVDSFFSFPPFDIGINPAEVGVEDQFGWELLVLKDVQGSLDIADSPHVVCVAVHADRHIILPAQPHQVPAVGL